MVDPNRKINRLTDKDIEFLEECEQEFGLRYSEEDAEFIEHCLEPLDDPPIIENWNFGGGDGSRNEGCGRHRGGFKHQRNWRGNSSEGSHGGGGRGYKTRNHRYRRSPDIRYGPTTRPSFNQQPNSSSNSPSMNIRRDYNNFVAASKEN